MSEHKPRLIKKTDIYFQTLLITGLCGFFGGLIWWLLRAFFTGGVAEKTLATVVVPVLIVILILTAGTFAIIAREGNKSLN